MVKKSRISTVNMVVLALSISGCSVDLSRIDDRLEPIASPLLSGGETGAALPKTNQPEPYASIVLKNFEEVEFRLDDNLKTLSLIHI